MLRTRIFQFNPLGTNCVIAWDSDSSVCTVFDPGMSSKEEVDSLADFLQGQIDFTRKLCAKAGDAHMEVTGENACPACHQGVMLQRKGKNGIFWGCSNYPQCRLTCNDKDGQPDMEDAARRAGRGSGSFSSAPSADDLAEFDALMAAGELAASYEPPSDWQGSKPGRQAWEDKPKYSARPMEKLQREEKQAGQAVPQGNKYLCPKCREGHLRLIKGRNGAFWGCTNYPRCTATFDDAKGAPVLN